MMPAVHGAGITLEPLAHQAIEQAAFGNPHFVRDRDRRVALRVVDGDTDLFLNVLHERAPARDVEHLDAAADCEQRKIGFDCSSRQLELVVVAAGLGRRVRRVRGLAVDRRQHIASAGQQDAVDRSNDVRRPVDRAVEHTDIGASSPDATSS